MIAAGSARKVELLKLNRRTTRWIEIAPLLVGVQPSVRHAATREEQVPPALRHLFW